MTTVTARVGAHHESDLTTGFRDLTAGPIPDGLIRTDLLRGQHGNWRIQSVWRDRDALEAVRLSTEPPAALELFRKVGADHSQRSVHPGTRVPVPKCRNVSSQAAWALWGIQQAPTPLGATARGTCSVGRSHLTQPLVVAYLLRVAFENDVQAIVHIAACQQRTRGVRGEVAGLALVGAGAEVREWVSPSTAEGGEFAALKLSLTSMHSSRCL